MQDSRARAAPGASPPGHRGLNVPVTLAGAALVSVLAGAYALEDRYQTQKAAEKVESQINGAMAADRQDLELAQAQSAAELTRDIEALRLQNVIMELESIEARELAGRGFPADATRKRQLLAQMDAIIQKLEK